jgi:dienelactone hydrolase
MRHRRQTQSFSVLPRATDPQIDTFNDEHTIYINPAVAPRKELLVFLPGTNGKTKNTKLFCTRAAELGYQVICLMYPDNLSATACWSDSDKESFTKFRLELIEGGEKSPYLEINRANSIENRLIKLLVYLRTQRPREGWEQFLSPKDELAWERLALAGQSQGGGHAALMAREHTVARVIMFSSPKDYSRRYNQPAAWYTTPNTPLSRYFTFQHIQDKQGCNYQQQLEILKKLGLTKLGEPVSVDTEKPPYAHSHILTTNYPGTPVPSTQAHTSVVGDGGTPKNEQKQPLFEPVWTYMLTEK